MKKYVSLFLSVLLIIGTASAAVLNIGFRAEATSDFKCGDDVTWYLDTQTGVMTVSGTGSTYDYESLGNKPFSEFNKYITSIVFQEGITRIGRYFLSSMSNLCSVTLPSTLEYLDYNYFSRSLTEIIIPDNNSLRYFDDYLTLHDTKWFNNQPEGVVYLGNCAIGFNGTIAESETIVLRDNTVAIAPSAFYNQSNLNSISFPDTLEFVGYRALDNTPFLESQPVGALYIGKALYKYIGNVTIEDYEFIIREGTVSVSSEAFSNKGIIKSVCFPESVRYICRNAFWSSSVTDISFADNSNLKYIGKSSFGLCRLNNFDLPEGLEYIDDLALNNYRPSLLKIPASVKKIGKLYGTGSTNIDLRARFEVAPENKFYCSDEFGCLFNKDKTVLIRAATQSGRIDYTVPDTVTEIAPGAFRYLTYSYSAIHLPNGLQKIGTEAFAHMTYDNITTDYTIDFGYSEPEISKDAFSDNRYSSSVIIRSMNWMLPEDIFSSNLNEDFTVYLMRGSAMQTYCDTYGINYEFLDYELRLGEINDLITIVETLDRTLYTEESLAALDEVVSQVDLELENLTQEQVDEWATAINNALSSLEYLPADYTALSEALARARAVNRSLYTADSLLALDTLVLSIDYNANITQQDIVDKTASDIIDAINALQFRGADYSKVNAAISRAVSVNRSMYTDSSVNNLESALQNVVYGLDITQQSRVDAYADSIELAITALVPKAADYTDVENAIARANAVNRSYYTATSLAALDEAIACVDYSLNYDNQQTVLQYARAINNAIESLVYLPADYTAVDSAVAQANAIDRIMWSASSLTALDQSVSVVNRNLNITQQPTVDAYAANILSKLNSLEYANVVLRNEPNGVIVGATSKEIYPTTSLSVDKLDPSNISSANFAVGGKVKTALYYDISLYRNSVKIQPDGTVTVKIRIPDGVESGKCKVYHITDDPVDPLVKFTSTLDGNYIVFETDHFSEFAVLEVETVLEGIVISTPPAKTVYAKGEAFDPEGMTVTAFFSDGTGRIVNDYDISVNTGSVGVETFTVYYTFNGVTKSVYSVITVEDNLPEINLKAPANTTAQYRTKITITAQATNMPDGCALILRSGDKELARSETGNIVFYAGEMTASQTFTVEVTDPDGKTLCYADSKPVRSDFRIEINSGFFAKIIAFFKALLKILPEKAI